jgi:hypothetical protein
LLEQSGGEQLMAGNPRIVTADATFTWDHASQRLGRGTIIDVPAGSALERAIGTDKLIPLYGAPPVTVAAEHAQDTPGATGDITPRPPARSRRSAPQAAAQDDASSDEKDTGNGEGNA